jgi:hypothetical protein
MRVRPVLQDKAAVAIGAFHEMLVAHFKKDARMAQRGAQPFGGAITGNAVFGNFNGFGVFGRHLKALWIDGADNSDFARKAKQG